MSVFLTPNQTKTVHIGRAQLTIHKKIIPDGMRATHSVASWVPKGGLMKPNQPFGKPGETLRGQARGICVHNTNMIQTPAATNPAEQYTRATFNGNMKGVVVHFYVWREEVWQNLALNERGWHAGDGQGRRAGRRAGQKIGGNLDTIAIEAIGRDKETTRTIALLCAWLCREHNLDPALDIWQHADFSPRSGCPVYLRPRWSCFVQQVKADYFCAGDATEKPARPVRACVGSPKRRRVCRAIRAARS
ncbi:MAG: peptidoglycan recognition protein family protein [Oscillospiraceae bacterium]|nr:peptidoglycan recognition protein family protein [Oscillospiraceae bacterium]